MAHAQFAGGSTFLIGTGIHGMGLTNHQSVLNFDVSYCLVSDACNVINFLKETITVLNYCITLLQ